MTKQLVNRDALEEHTLMFDLAFSLASEVIDGAYLDTIHYFMDGGWEGYNIKITHGKHMREWDDRVVGAWFLASIGSDCSLIQDDFINALWRIAEGFEAENYTCIVREAQGCERECQDGFVVRFEVYCPLYED